VLVDAHAHLDQYGSSWPEVLEEIRRLEILTLAVSMDPPSFERTRGLCANQPLLIPAFGVHPWKAPGWEDDGAYFAVGVELLRSPHIETIARRIPEDRILTETDNPGGWQWLKGVPGRPSLLPRVLDRLAEVRGVARERMEEIVAANAARLFGLGPGEYA
jgi:Tat protein secretion system quality control protein TatD with DNase activity